MVISAHGVASLALASRINASSRQDSAGDVPLAFQTDGLQVRCATSMDDLGIEWPSALQPGDAIGHVFQMREFLEVWLRRVAPGRGTTPCFCAVVDDTGAPVILLPLGIESHRGARVLSFLDAELSDYNGPILFPAALGLSANAFQSLWNRILESLPPFDVIAFDKLPADIHGHVNPLAALDTQPQEFSCHQARLIDTLQGFTKKRSGTLRSLSRAKRFLRQRGTYHYLIARDEAQATAFLDTLFAQKKRRAEDTMVPDMYENPGIRDFYLDLTREHLDSGLVHLSAVEIGETRIAAQWSLVMGRHYYYLVPGHEAGEWVKASPGRILNEEVLRWCYDNGISLADFGVGDEAYKFEYCDVHIPLHMMRHARTGRGRVYLATERTLQKLRASRLWQTVRPYKWTVRRWLATGRS